MRVTIRFIPELLSKYFDMGAVETLNLPEGCTYNEIMRLLEEKFKSDDTEYSLLDAFIIMSGGESIARKLEEQVKPGDDVTVVSIALGG